MLRKYEVSVCGGGSARLVAPLGALIVFLAAPSLTCSVDHGGIEPKQVSRRDAGPSDLLVALPDDAAADAIGPGTADDGAAPVSGTGGSGTASGSGTGGAGASPPGTGGVAASGGMTGGMDAGGATGMGTGGAASGGADNETGGAGPGGAASGGTSTGGAATGGRGTGGAATGGRGTGGAATGGAATGGAATGGRGTGGAATGGAASGGAGGMTTGVCNPANCAAGCCSGTVCVTNTSALRCGRGGSICQVCGGCLRCSSTSSCEVDPMSQWTMTAVSATIAPKYPDGSDWDPGQRLGPALPDPFVQFEMPPIPASGNPPPGDITGDTTTKMDTLSPLWNESILQPGTPVRARDLLAGGKPWLLWVGDEDEKLSADLVCQIMSPMDPAAFAAGGITRTNLGSCLSLSIKLTCQP